MEIHFLNGRLSREQKCIIHCKFFFFHGEAKEADVILERFKKHYQHMENERVAFHSRKNLSRPNRYVVTYF